MRIYLSLNCSGVWSEYTGHIDLTNYNNTINLDANNDIQKSITGEIEAYSEAYKFIKSNLIDSINRYSNSICVKIIDQFANEKLFKIENSNLRWCENNECKIRLSLVDYNINYDCIKNTVISDNSNGLFQEYPSAGMIHPRFRYCDIMKPTLWFGIIVTFVNAVDLFILSINIFLNITINPIIIAINSLLGTNFDTVSIPYLFDSVSGCNLAHPSPFVRTYIDNVCAICGISTDINSNPIFYDNITPSQYYNLCLLTAYNTKGVKIVGNRDYIVNNRPSWTLFDLCSKLKDVFNARWNIVNGVLYFERKDKISQLIWGLSPTWDVSDTGQDKINILVDPCFTYNGKGKPSRINIKYGTDASDNIGNELLCRYNGEYIVPYNPNYNTPTEVTIQDFGAMSFVLDGKDTLYDANLQQAVGTILSNNDYNGSLKTQGDTLAIAKLIIWDGISIDDARAQSEPYISYLSVSSLSEDDGAVYPITLSDIKYFNTPMSFDYEANTIQKNLWDFHSIDVPNNSKETNIQFELDFNFCEQYLSFDLFQRIKFNGNRIGEISYINYNYTNNSIKIKGDII